jgi:hypothetical protein
MSASHDAAQALGEVGRAFYAAINACTNPDQLVGLNTKLWAEAHPRGWVNDEEATYLTACIERRRPTGPRMQPAGTPNMGRLAGRLQRRFTPRKPQRSPDRKASRDRRRMLGGSSCMPPKMSLEYTEGERAVMCIIAGEIKHHGLCDLSIDEIAARAGVCRTTAQNAMHEARRLRHITVLERPRLGMKSLTNVVRICSKEWLAWVKRGPSAAKLIGSNSVKKLSPTVITDLRKQELCNENDLRRGHGLPTNTVRARNGL